MPKGTKDRGGSSVAEFDIVNDVDPEQTGSTWVTRRLTMDNGFATHERGDGSTDTAYAILAADWCHSEIRSCRFRG